MSTLQDHKKLRMLLGPAGHMHDRPLQNCISASKAAHASKKVPHSFVSLPPWVLPNRVESTETVSSIGISL